MEPLIVKISLKKKMTLIELIWTITPALVLIAIAFPSFRLLYLLDEVTSPTVTIKVTGHQWYWSTHPFVLSLNNTSHNLSSGLILLSLLGNGRSQSPFHNTILSSTLTLKKYQLKTIFRNYSVNHEKTFSIIDKGMNHSSISRKVKLFLQNNRIINPLHSQYDVLRDEVEIPNSLKFYTFNDISDLSEIKNKAGIYRIIIANTSDYYIGSATDLSIRFLQHRNKARKSFNQNSNLKLYRTIREVDSTLLSFEILEYTTNFIYKFRELYPDTNLNENEIELMQLMSLYECALKEQLYLGKLKPSLNSRLFATTSTKLSFLENNIINPQFAVIDRIHLDNINLINPLGSEDSNLISRLGPEQSHNQGNDIFLSSSSNFVNNSLIIPKTYSDKDISHWLIDSEKPVQIYNVKGVNIGSFTYQREAGKELGVSHNMIARYGKSTDVFLSPALGMKVSVSIVNVKKTGNVIHPSAKKHSKLVVNLDLPKNRICVISSDLSAVVNTFKSFKEAAQYFELPDYRRIRRYFGTEKLIKTSKGEFYFTGETDLIKYYEENKPILNKTLLVYDLSNESVILSEVKDTNSILNTKVYTFSSINQAEKELKIHHTFISKHLNKGTVYKGQDGRKFLFKLVKGTDEIYD